jgi:acetolactate synthase-1/2/3 large subunit
MTTVATVLVETLRRLGADRVFGLPGVQNLELFDALAEANVPTFTPSIEGAVMFMADAHARITGTTSVALVTAGPGLTNALTGLAEAKLDSTPLLLLVGSSQSNNPRAFQLHEIAQEEIVRPLVKGYFRPKRSEDVVAMVEQAWALTCECEPGPVVVELSSPLLMEQGRFSLTNKKRSAEPVDLSMLLDSAAKLLSGATAVGIYAGAGAFGAESELVALAERLQAPVATTMSGRGIVPEDHPLCVGYGFGRSGTAAAWRAFRRVKTLLAVGCKYGETATGSYGIETPREHIHIDINPASIGANYPVTLAIPADAKMALGGLLARLATEQRPTNTGLVEIIRESRTRAESRAMQAAPVGNRVRPSRFLRLLRSRLTRDAILVTDCGMHQFWALSDFPVYAPRSFLAPADFQAMGFSIPGALAAKLARPQRQVVALVGDGGFLMSGFECLNAARWNASISVVVFRDGAWGLIREAQRRVYRQTPYTELPDADYRQLAAGFGMKYVQIASDTEIETGLDEVFSVNTACLVEVRVDYSAAPDYVRGAGPQMFKQLPLRLKAGIALRYLQRSLFRSSHKKGAAAVQP